MAPASSWLDIPDESHFSLSNIPFGIISAAESSEKCAAVAIGDHVLNLREFAQHDGFAELPEFSSAHFASLSRSSLNDFAALGQHVHNKVRRYLQNIFAEPSRHPQVLRDNAEARKACLSNRDQVAMHLPMSIRGYTDFFAGKNHAYNCGCIFRDPEKALNPNYHQLPVAYNSRASSVVVSPANIQRPLGQYLSSPASTKSTFGPCRRLDLELELGALLCKDSTLGDPINVNEADSYIFGFVLLNDWSARDIQAFEATPLGPFNAKTFATTISPWVILPSALEPFRTSGLPNEHELHPYLRQTRKDNVYDINLSVDICSKFSRKTTHSLSLSPYVAHTSTQRVADLQS